MFYLDGISLSKIKIELEENLTSKKIGKIFQNSSLSLTLHFGKKALFFSCNPSLPICYINEDKEENFLEENSSFLLLIRKYLINSALIKIEQLGFDRILKFSFSKINELGEIQNNFLYFEIMGKYSNVILTDKDNKIISVLKKKSLEENSLRTLFNGEVYTQPIVTKKINPLYITEKEFEKYLEENNIVENIEGIGKLLKNQINSFEDLTKFLKDNISPKIYFKNDTPILATVLNIIPKDFDKEIPFSTYVEMINNYIKLKSLSNSFTLLKNRLFSVLDKEEKKSLKILKNIKKDIEIMKEHEKYKNLGDILASVLYSIKKGDTKVKAYDFYNNCEITIDIDPLLSPQSNLSKIYKKSSKMKRGLEISKERLVEFSNKLTYIDSVRTFIEKSKNIEELKNIEKELIEEKYIIEKNNKKNKKKTIEVPYGTINLDNKILYFGRNNKENDYLTFKFARKDDMWFHIKDMPGSHFIVKKEDFVNDEEFIKKVAEYSAYYSKANSGEKVVVDYTEKKNLNKPKGAPLGFVTYNIWDSITVITPEKI
ncbi:MULTISPECIES: NFACT family protein [Fusobacterium]|uniref:Rqc2 family fibronectin-binding protein n=1 Tax=Fusobacterium TaxID=848 RepID=UPI001476E36B|nr:MULTISPECIES: NFACT family protein [Fusobacterium]NME36601.1 fibronectin-binding domain-containing protein [Fusobacterium sp. FSA-380-WT-3A]